MKTMEIIGVQLRTPHLSDLPMTVFILAVASALVGFFMFALGWDIGQASAIIYGFAAVAIANACGVDLRAPGVRGFLVIMLLMLALVVSTVGLHLMFN